MSNEQDRKKFCECLLEGATRAAAALEQHFGELDREARQDVMDILVTLASLVEGRLKREEAVRLGDEFFSYTESLGGEEAVTRILDLARRDEADANQRPPEEDAT